MADKTRAAPSVEALIARLSDPRPHVRADAAYALSDSYDARAIPPLVPLLRDPQAAVRANAAYALYHLDARHIGQDLLPLLSDPVVEARLSAILAIGRCPEPRALAPLLALLDDPEDSVRDYVCQYGFAGVGSLAVPALLDRLHDTRGFMRAGAARALALPSRQRLTGAPDILAQSPYALSPALLRRVLRALTAALGDTDPAVRYQAVCALAVHGDPQTVPALLDALLAEHDQGNRAAIADCLRQCNAGPLLDEQIAGSDPAVRARAETGLAHFMWSMLKDGDDIAARLREVAPQHRPSFDRVTAEFMADFESLQTEVQDAVASRVAHRPDRQDRVQRGKRTHRMRRTVSPELVPAVRRALEGKSYDHILWSVLQPCPATAGSGIVQPTDTEERA
jgi:HEAT repeat protein